jgi:HK97 family phage major capsid protein
MKRHLLMSAALAAHMATAPAALASVPRADASGLTAKALEDIKASIATMRDDVMKQAEAALKEAKASGDVGAELKAQIDALMPKFNEASTAQAKLEGQLEALETRALGMEQIIAQGGGGAQQQMTVGQHVAESDELKAYLANGMNGTAKITLNAAVTSADGSGGGLIWEDRDTAVDMPRRTLKIRDLLTVINTGSDLVKYTKQVTRTHQGGMTAEGAAPTASEFGWTKAEAAIRKIVALTHGSDEAFADAAQLMGLLNTELRYEVELVEETQLLSGNNTGENLNGMMTWATAFAAQAGLPNATHTDRLRLAMLQVVLNDYAADAFVLSPIDWAAIELTKDTTGRYIVGSAEAPAGPSLWRLPVAESNSMTAGSWLCGAFKMAATLYDRQQTEILISSEHGTNFVDGMKTIKATKRQALAERRAASLVTGNFTFA